MNESGKRATMAAANRSYPNHRRSRFPGDSRRMVRPIDENSSVQALLGEAIDLLMRERGKHPFGER